MKSKFKEDEPLGTYLFVFSFVIAFDTLTIWRFAKKKKHFLLEGLVRRNFRRNFVNYEKLRLSGEI